jgi:cyclic pyranopterin phosphate synthase
MSYEIAESCRPTAAPAGTQTGLMHGADGPALIDGFGRKITYLRMSVTDRCDFRCTYCMAESMRFLPHEQIMSFEEATRLASVFTSMGVTKIRVTGGEPLVRKDVTSLLARLSTLPGMRELAITTNGSQLGRMADGLRRAGVSSLNISLDSLRDDRFHKITRTGELKQVLTGIFAARMAGFARIRLNAVLMKGVNDDEIEDLAHFAVDRDVDLAFIEEMPLGGIDAREGRKMLADTLIERLSKHFALDETADNTGGPARYWRVRGTHTRVGLITPHSNNFCQTCNRVRVTAKGELFPCLGQDTSVDLLPILRSTDDDAPLRDAILHTMGIKPAGHEFDGVLRQNAVAPKIMRFMSLTGG